MATAKCTLDREAGGPDPFAFFAEGWVREGAIDLTGSYGTPEGMPGCESRVFLQAVKAAVPPETEDT